MSPRCVEGAMVTTGELQALARGVIGAGFDGTTPENAPLAELQELQPGAVMLFGRNVGSAGHLRRLIAALRAVTPLPPLIAIDQEGGRVARIRDDAVAQLPSAMAFGAAGDPALARTCAALLGRDLARLGISVDFAPVADLALAPASTVIGTRAFGDDPRRAGDFAAAFARGLREGGVAAAVKHFPGHGATAADSHDVLPHVDSAAEIPFVRAIAAGGAAMVMAAHVVVDAIDPDVPASLSPAVLTGLLRGTMGFTGVIVTDCLQMDAIAGGIGTVPGAVRAIAAGADLALISHDPALARGAAEAVAAAAADGTLPPARLQEAAARVCALRERYAVLAPCEADLDANAPAAAALRSITVLRGDVRLSGDAVTVMSFEGGVTDRAARSGATAGTEDATLSSALRRRKKKSELMRVPLAPAADDVELLLEHLPRLGEREFIIVIRRADLYPAQRDAVARILEVVPNAILVSSREPFDALLWPAARRVLCTYGDEPLAFAAAAGVLCGAAPAQGVLPVRVSETFPVR